MLNFFLPLHQNYKLPITFFRAFCIPIVLLLSVQVKADFSAKAEISTDRIFRGVSQIESGLAPSATLAYQSEFGAYLGVSLAKNDFRIPEDSLEQLYFLGYHRELNNDIGLDISYLRYQFDDLSNGPNRNWNELHLRLQFTPSTALLLISSDSWLRNQESQQIEISHLRGVTEKTRLHMSAGVVIPSGQSLENYHYAEIGLIYGISANIYLRGDLSLTDDVARDLFNSQADNTVRVSLGYLF